MPTSIADIQKLGYDCGIAHGDVASEEAALAAAQADADPQAVIEKVNAATLDTVQTLANIGKLPDAPEERLDLSQKIAAAALEMLTEHVTERVDFHERALAIAKESPDVWHVAGPGFSIYVACKEDGTGWDDDSQSLLDGLIDPTAHAERTFQAENPDALAAADTLEAAGMTVTRERGAATFTVDGQNLTAVAITKLADSKTSDS